MHRRLGICVGFRGWLCTMARIILPKPHRRTTLDSIYCDDFILLRNPTQWPFYSATDKPQPRLSPLFHPGEQATTHNNNYNKKPFFLHFLVFLAHFLDFFPDNESQSPSFLHFFSSFLHFFASFFERPSHGPLSFPMHLSPQHVTLTTGLCFSLFFRRADVC